MKSTTLLLCLLLSSGVALNAFAAQGKIYKWTDAKGQVHFGSQPPANTNAQVMGTKAISEPVEGEAATQAAAGTPSAPSADKKTTAKASNSSPKTKDPERCSNAKENVEKLNGYARIKVKDEDGNYRILTQEEQQQKLTEFNKAIEESCE